MKILFILFMSPFLLSGIDFYLRYLPLNEYADGWGFDKFAVYTFCILSVYSILSVLFFDFISKKYNKQRELFWENVTYFSLFFSLIPFFNTIYPILLWFSKGGKKHIQLIYMTIGLFISHIYLYFRAIMDADKFVEGIGVLYFFPLLLLLLCIFKPKNLFLKIWKYFSILFLFLILIVQPFFRGWFFDESKWKNQEICYPREDIYEWTCFKIFQGYNIFR